MQSVINRPGSGVTCCYGEFLDFIGGGYVNGGGYYGRNNINEFTPLAVAASLRKLEFIKREMSLNNTFWMILFT